LDLSCNRIRGPLPETLGEFANLRRLNLDFNRVTQIPASIARNTRLERLTAAHNQIVAIPGDLFGMPRLDIVDLRFNQIHFLPRDLPPRSNLKILRLEHNFIERIPPVLGEWTELIEFRYGYPLSRTTYDPSHFWGSIGAYLAANQNPITRAVGEGIERAFPGRLGLLIQCVRLSAGDGSIAELIEILQDLPLSRNWDRLIPSEGSSPGASGVPGLLYREIGEHLVPPLLTEIMEQLATPATHAATRPLFYFLLLHWPHLVVDPFWTYWDHHPEAHHCLRCDRDHLSAWLRVEGQDGVILL
jgi:hypothetical protein